MTGDLKSRITLDRFKLTLQLGFSGGVLKGCLGAFLEISGLALDRLLHDAISKPVLLHVADLVGHHDRGMDRVVD